jgi:two-component system cell cycle response regulator CpdR
MSRIMIVTQDDVIRSYLAKRLARAGHAVTKVCDFDAAITILCESSYDLLLTSVDTNDHEGLLLANEARHIDPEIRVMFLTGFSAVALEDTALDEEDLPTLSSPVHLKYLVDEVARLLIAA